MAYRKAKQYCESQIQDESNKNRKIKGIINRIMDNNFNMLSMAFNKLLEEYKYNTKLLKDKMRFIIASLTNNDKKYVYMAYNMMKERKMMLDGVGLGDKESKKHQILKRMMDQGYNLMS